MIDLNCTHSSREKKSINFHLIIIFLLIQQAAQNAVTCITNLVDFSTLQDEIEKAKPEGNVDTVFNKYCDQRGKAIQCVENFTQSIEPCLTDEEKDQKVVFVNITKSLLEFICHENGNQIARESDLHLIDDDNVIAQNSFITQFSLPRYRHSVHR